VFEKTTLLGFLEKAVGWRRRLCPEVDDLAVVFEILIPFVFDGGDVGLVLAEGGGNMLGSMTRAGRPPVRSFASCCSKRLLASSSDK
jgi:hypothetical protein